MNLTLTDASGRCMDASGGIYMTAGEASSGDRR